MQWGDSNNGLFEPSEKRTYKCNTRNNSGNVGHFGLAQLKFVLQKMKNNKATGPDDIPIELFKLLDDENLQWVLDICNSWWDESDFPNHLLRALIASIFKKGDPKKQQNYRPISLLNIVYKIYAALLRDRLMEAVDEDAQRTQYGFRRSRSTSEPVHCVKRIVEAACSSQEPVFLVFLDWEKAFDRVRQDKLLEALERLEVDQKMIKAIQSLYNKPQFAVNIGGKKSEWKTQTRGIRQGCPLSPYLFVLLMTVLFRDVHKDLNLTRGVWGPISFTELLYADDTVLVTNNVNAMNRFIAKIESQAAYYGLQFNKQKCVSLTINSANQPHFANGEKVPASQSTIYLGANINTKDDPKQDINQRLRGCFAILNRLNFFWQKSNCPTRFKLSVFDAVIRSKLVYSLECVQMSAELFKKVDAVQFKGLRRILGLQHTYINRQNTNQSILQKANSIKNLSSEPNKDIRPFSEYLRTKQESLLKHIVRAQNNNPMRETTLRHGSALPHTVANRRVGRPKKQWALQTYERIWCRHDFGNETQYKADTDGAILKMESCIRERAI